MVKAAGMLSDTPQALQSTKKKMQELLQKHPVSKSNKDIQELILEPLPKLTQAFAEGLIRKTEKREKPIVLIFDTYEKVFPDIDTWLWQYLLVDTNIKSHPIRLVIAGRRSLVEKENWRKLQQDYDIIYAIQLNEFNKDQTKEYLNKIGVNKPQQINKIYRATKGLPYYLNWIRKEKEADKDVDFTSGNKKILELLLQGLNTKQKQIVQIAACCRWFDKSLIKYLTNNQDIDFDCGADARLNCFDWLAERDFVEFVQGCYRLDDVARDVFRLSLYQEDRNRFCATHQLLADYFKQQADREVSPNKSIVEKYDNAYWLKYTTEFMYYSLFANKEEGQRQLISHIFTSRYLKKKEYFLDIFKTVILEAKVSPNLLLPNQTSKFFEKIKLAFPFGWLMLTSNPKRYEINYEQKQGPSQKEIELALRHCFDKVDFIDDGLGKYAGLLYKSLRYSSNDRTELLVKAKEQAEKIPISIHTEFRSGLFINVGIALGNSKNHEEALACFDKALEIKDDMPEAWFFRGIALAQLENYEESLASFDKALEIKENVSEAWHNRGKLLARSEKYEEALASFDKALRIENDAP